MEQKKPQDNEVITVDLRHILRVLWYRAWIIALVGILAASAGFCYAKFMVQPQYSSSVLLYVNNSSFSVGDIGFSFSASDISAARGLVDTYTEFLKNRTTLERVIQKTEVDYTYQQLYSMINAQPSNETEVMRVTVTCGDPYEAARIANGIAEVLPIRVSEIVDGASMEVVDSAIPNLQKISPSISKYTLIAMLVGVLAAAGILAAVVVMDDTIHSEEMVLEICNYPILARIPNLQENPTDDYSYQYERSHARAASKREAGEEV